jgi:phosphoribosylamine-glycine ligase
MNGDLDGLVKKADFVVSEYSFPRTLIRRIRSLCKKYGTPCVGANSDAFVRLETDRIYAKQVAKSALDLDNYGVRHFTTHEELQAAMSLSRKQLAVLKPFKENNLYYESAYIMNPHDAIYLSNSIKNKVYPAGGMVVEDFLEGYEVCLGGYFDGKSFHNRVLVNQEYKGALEGNEGNILTGEVGTVLQWKRISDLPHALSRVMYKLENLLRTKSSIVSNGYYIGFIDINLMIVKGKVHLLEFTTRQGIPTEAEVLNTIDEYGKFLADLSGYRMDGGYTIDYETLYVCGCLCTYGLPYGLAWKVKKMRPQVFGLEKLKNPYQILWGCYDGDTVRSFLADRVLIVHGKGKTLKKAMDQYRSEASKISCWHSMIRKDIGYRWKEIEYVI